MKPENPRWERFKRFVAAIRRAVDPRAQVKWNDSINGRQFDVTLRFRKGLYDYLTAIECNFLRNSASAIAAVSTRRAGCMTLVMVASVYIAENVRASSATELVFWTTRKLRASCYTRSVLVINTSGWNIAPRITEFQSNR